MNPPVQPRRLTERVAAGTGVLNDRVTPAGRGVRCITRHRLVETVIMHLANRDDGPELDIQSVLAVARSWDRRAGGLVHLRTGDNANWRVSFGGRT
jgi:hypothetical protein